MTKTSKNLAKSIKKTKADLQFEKMKYVVSKLEEHGVDRETIVNYMLAYDETSHGYLPKLKLAPFSEQEKREEQDRLQSSINALIKVYGFSQDQVQGFLCRYASREYLGSEIATRGLEARTRK